MSIKRQSKQEYYDGLIGLEEELVKSKKQISQCAGCKFDKGVTECTKFGEKPYEYASVLQNAQCPERKEK